MKQLAWQISHRQSLLRGEHSSRERHGFSAAEGQCHPALLDPASKPRCRSHPLAQACFSPPAPPPCPRLCSLGCTSSSVGSCFPAPGREEGGGDSREVWEVWEVGVCVVLMGALGTESREEVQRGLGCRPLLLLPAQQSATTHTHLLHITVHFRTRNAPMAALNAAPPPPTKA